MAAGPMYDNAVVEMYDDWLARAVPGHDDMRRLVAWVVCDALAGGGVYADLGCARGAQTRAVCAMADAHHLPGFEVHALDESLPMLDAARRSLDGCARDDRPVTVEHHDLGDGLPQHLRRGPIDAATAVLTLQYLDVPSRAVLLGQLGEAMAADGRLVVVEQVNGHTPPGSLLLGRWYAQFRHRQGPTDDDVVDAALGMGTGAMLTAGDTEQLLRAAGFVLERVWSHGPFVAWVCWRGVG